MDIKHLRTFVTVARLGSITKTAEALHPQPAVSGQIKSLEEALDVKLLRTPSPDADGRRTGSQAARGKGDRRLRRIVNAAKSRRAPWPGCHRLAMYDPAVMRVGALMQRLARDPGLRVDLQVGRISWFYDAAHRGNRRGHLGLPKQPARHRRSAPENMVFELVMPAAWDAGQSRPGRAACAALDPDESAQPTST